MEISRASGMKAPMATPWYIVSDKAGVGTDVVTSTNMVHIFGNILPENYWNVVVEVQATIQKTGGSGLAYVWVKIDPVGHQLVTTPYTPPVRAYTTRNAALETAITRKWLIKLDVFASSGNATQDQLDLYVEATGSKEDTAFSLTDIKSRLIYFPF
jgi:hypothetical protein